MTRRLIDFTGGNMKSLLLFAALVVATPAHSAEMVSESHFHLLSTKCEAEVADGPESTPQSPPLVVDDPATPGCNKWEINVVVDGDVTRLQSALELPLLDINYGVGDNLQLKYELPYMNNQAEGTTTSALGESRAGVKYMFFENEEAKLQFAVYPQLTFISSNAEVVKNGLASPGTITTLPLLMAVRVGQAGGGDVNLTANLGYNVSTKEDVSNFVSASVGVGSPVLRRLSVMGELTTEQAISRNSDEARQQLVKADLGVMGTISKKFLLFGSVGHSLYASDELDHTYVLGGFRVVTGGI